MMDLEDEDRIIPLINHSPQKRHNINAFENYGATSPQRNELMPNQILYSEDFMSKFPTHDVRHANVELHIDDATPIRKI